MGSTSTRPYPLSDTPESIAIDSVINTVKGHTAQLKAYPGTGEGETHGAQTASGTVTDSTIDTTTIAMLQTVYNLLRANGLLA